MLADRRFPDDEECPVCDELLGELYSASKYGLPVLVATVAPEVRAILALFCYRRSHLLTIGLAIAASCAEDDLLRAGGRIGATLFTKSREVPVATVSHSAYRRKITLATGSLRNMAPIDIEPDDEEVTERIPADA